MRELLKEVEGEGGEGLMLRRPGSLYEGKRSGTLLKVKSFFDAEAEVVGYEAGKGKHKGATGALKVGGFFSCFCSRFFFLFVLFCFRHQTN